MSRLPSSLAQAYNHALQRLACPTIRSLAYNKSLQPTPGSARAAELVRYVVDARPMLMQRWAGEIFADYNQFYLWDSGRTNHQTISRLHRFEDVISRRIKTGDSRGRDPARAALHDVPVVIETHDAEPSITEEEWDHIAEASLHLPTALQVDKCTGGVVTDFKVPNHALANPAIASLLHPHVQ